MPTGYTAGVSDGSISDFRTFALRCARNFGATIMQRDEPMDVPPKHREVSDYYAKSVEEARLRVNELASMTVEDAEIAAQAEYEKSLANDARYDANRQATKARYSVMLSEVQAWEPPTVEHIALKTFMVKQLTESIDFDCTSYPSKRIRYKADVWLREQKTNAAQRLARAEQNLTEEIDRCKKANDWIDALYASLNSESRVSLGGKKE
jgi:hypothetical protein